MSASEINTASRPSADPSDNQLRGSSVAIHMSFSYQQLTEFHIERCGVDEDGNERPEQSLDNERSVIRGWLAHWKLGPSDPAGEELGVSFDESLSRYLSALEGRGLSKRTIADRRSIVKKLRESFRELSRTNGLLEGFGDALKYLVERDSTSASQISRNTGIPRRALGSWMNGNCTPKRASLPLVRELERAFKVPTGSLSSKLPDVYWSTNPTRSCATAWRSHLSKLSKLRYRLPRLTARLQEEWDEVLQVFTDPQSAINRGFKVNSTWRVRWNNNRCVTAEVKLSSLRSFFGYLCLPTSAPDRRMAGMGFNPRDLTLALLTDSEVVLNFLHFMKGRSVTDSFNYQTVNFLSFCTMLMRAEVGYLRQRPEFGAKLPQPVVERDWDTWCEDNRRKLLEFLNKISGKNHAGVDGKNRVRMTRDPFEPVIDIIKERQHPLTALFDLAGRLDSLTPLLEMGRKEALAVHSRSIFQVRLIGSNPLRSENFSMMTYIPQSYASFERTCRIFRRCRDEKRTPDFSELRVETTGDSNLYQKRDGSWRLRFDERDFKNERGGDLEKGVRHTPYDVPVVLSVWPALSEYLFRHRPVLNESLVNAIRQIRARHGLPELTPEEELAIVRCPYVFRPRIQGTSAVGIDRVRAGYGTGQMPALALSNHIFSLTSRYLPESKGFGAHACRHLVATEYIKNHPNGWEAAAAALHNTADMVRRHYSWVEVGDLIKPWNDYHEQLKEKHDRGEL